MILKKDLMPSNPPPQRGEGKDKNERSTAREEERERDDERQRDVLGKREGRLARRARVGPERDAHPLGGWASPRLESSLRVGSPACLHIPPR